jgi:hypothetical protein
MQKSRNQWDNNFSKRQEKNIFGPLNSGNGIETKQKTSPLLPLSLASVRAQGTAPTPQTRERCCQYFYLGGIAQRRAIER